MTIPIAQSAFEEGAQVLRNRLVENVIVERVEEVFPVVLAGQKVADIPVDRRHCDPGLRRWAFYGEVHGEVFLPRLEI